MSQPRVRALEAEIHRRLREPLPGSLVHRRFAPLPSPAEWRPDLEPADARRAATLILIYPGPTGPTVPLTVRRADLAHHPAQVSLPGGELQAGEAPSAAALREAFEEIGVPSDDVRIAGRLSPLWVSVSNFVIEPFVGFTDTRPAFLLHQGEVERLLEIPVDHLSNSSRLAWTSRERDAGPFEYPFFNLEGHVVWGATAMILGEFGYLLNPDLAPPERIPAASDTLR